MISLRYVSGEDKTGQKGEGLSHWEASANKEFDAVGDTPLEAVTELSESMFRYIQRQHNRGWKQSCTYSSQT